VNRVVPPGTAIRAAQRLAAELAALPQVCLRHDRLSVLEQDGMDESDALANELRHGSLSLAEGRQRHRRLPRRPRSPRRVGDLSFPPQRTDVGRTRMSVGWDAAIACPHGGHRPTARSVPRTARLAVAGTAGWSQ
jgi:hypothetical protein